MLPDDVKEDTEYQAGIRNEADRITSVEESPGITEDEIWKALSSMGRKKAPGYDDITVEIWIMTWPIVRDRVVRLFNDV